METTTMDEHPPSTSLRRSTRISNKRSSPEVSPDRDSKRQRQTEPPEDAANNTTGTEDGNTACSAAAAATATVAVTTDILTASTRIEVEAADLQHTHDLQPFRLVDLPAEIRIEIYRACLTRPFDIVLSKKPPPPPPPERITWRLLESEAERDLRRRRVAAQERANLRWANSRAASQTHAPLSGPRTRRRTRQNPQGPQFPAPPLRAALPRGPVRAQPEPEPEPPRPAPRPQDLDPLLVNLLRASQLVYKEARPVLYGENSFLLEVHTALASLAALHQRSRGQIRFIRLSVPSHSDILERFAEIVRLSLRYCWRLQVFTIDMPPLPHYITRGNPPSANSAVYANAFDILRWLPRQCKVVLAGHVSDEVRTVVQRNANLAKSLDERAYARRQLISSDVDRDSISSRMAAPRTPRNINLVTGQISS